MKKILPIFCLLAFAYFATAQTDELKSKNGATILPQEGDWALGFDAAPFLNYAGNLLNSNAASPTADWTNNNFSITGKNFVSPNLAYRVTVRIGLGGYQLNNLIDSSTSLFGGPVYLVDNMNYSYHNIQLGGGIESRRGNGRLQGIYGFEVLFSLTGEKESYTYEDNFDADHTAQWTTNFLTGASNASNGPRATEVTYGKTFGMNTRGFIGVEYFVLPKVSISAEYGWGLSFVSQADGTTSTESFGLADANATEASIISNTSQTAGSSSWGFDTDNNNASLTIMFHF